MFWIGFIAAFAISLAIGGFFLYFQEMFRLEKMAETVKISIVLQILVGFAIAWETGLGVIAGIAVLLLFGFMVEKIRSHNSR